ncbi:MAG: methylated-DNA--[protein]-cysteine S-methyltransferase [Proteobacteria bacterium]|nr:methylated-DNA--[protein]-cysteine S-methyltransferase [Pseudomonadota bacterium]
MDYQAKLSAPFGVIGIRCKDNLLINIDFLSSSEAPQRATSAFAEKVCAELLRYFENPDAQFSIPLKYTATTHQQKVWQAMLAIPRGQTRSYGELATELHSCAQAVGQACGANPIPIIIPCHRVVGRAGLGGFMKSTGDTTLTIKRWLLAHEGIKR